MAGKFSSGYALLIATNENAVAEYALPDVAKDIAAMEVVLKHEQRCAYDPMHVKVIIGKDAMRQAILDSLDWLEEQIQKDASGNATGLIYYSGHGWRDESTSMAAHYLIPYDMRPGPIPPRALRAEDFAAAVSALTPHRLLVILDCCHSGGMGVKEARPLASGFVPAPIPAALFMSGAKGVMPAQGAKGLEALSLGAGRAVLSSSQGVQPSYIRKDRRMSIFTYHLIEALTGHAQPAEGASEVLVSDVMSHVWRRVPESARQDWGQNQQPDYQVSGNFPVALLLGGKGLTKGVAAPDPLAPLAATGPATVFDQREQTVHGPQTNIAGNVHGPVLAGEFVRRDKIIHGDEVHGDKVAGDMVGGDKITVGNISGSTGIAIGRGSQAHLQGIGAAELESLFAPLVSLARGLPPEQRGPAEQKIKELKQEVAKGKSAEDGRLATLINGLVGLAPGAVSTVASMFATPILAGIVGPMTKLVLNGLKGG